MTDQLPDPVQPSIASSIPSDLFDVTGAAVRHAPEVKQLALACWIEANGNAERAHRLLAQECPKYTIVGDQVPTARTIRRWSQSEGWELLLVRAVGQSYGHLLELYTARLVRLCGQGLDTLDEVTSPGYVPTKEDKIRVDAAKHITTIMAQVMDGLNAGRGTLAKHEAPRDREDTRGLSPLEHARRQHALIAEQNEERRKQR